MAATRQTLELLSAMLPFAVLTGGFSTKKKPIKLFCNDTLAKVMKNNNYFTQDKECNVKFKITMMTYT